mgnify:CR=1 FL=1
MSESDIVIRVEGLSKKYALHHEQSEHYTALPDEVARQAKAAGRLLNPITLPGQLRKARRLREIYKQTIAAARLQLYRCLRGNHTQHRCCTIDSC